MLKIIFAICLHNANLIDSSVIGNTNESNRWFESYIIPFVNYFGQSESSETINDTELRSNLVTNDDSPKPLEDVLEILQKQIDKSNDSERKRYENLLTTMKKMLVQKTRYVNVFFKHMRFIADLGHYGSNQRLRNVSIVNTIIENIQDLLLWIYDNVYDLFTWNIKRKKDTSHQTETDENYTEHDEKVINQKPGEHGKAQRMAPQPLEVKVDMDVKFRIYDERDKHKKHKPEGPVKPEDVGTQEKGAIAGIFGKVLKKSVESAVREDETKQKEQSKPGEKSKSEEKGSPPNSKPLVWEPKKPASPPVSSKPEVNATPATPTNPTKDPAPTTNQKIEDKSCPVP